MKLALAIIHYNENEYLDNLFRSIASSTVLPKKIVFVDNNSAVNPKSIINKYKNKLNIEFIRTSENIFFTRGVNIAIRRAIKCKAEVIGIMNSDMRVQSNTFEEVIKKIQYPGVVAVTPNIRNLADTKTGFGPIKYRGIFGKSCHIHSNADVVETDFMIGASVFIKRDTLFKTGLFYEPFVHGTEDYEFSDKVRKQGKILYVNTTNIFHRDSAERVNSKSKKGEFFESLDSKNWYIYCLRNKKPVLILVFISILFNAYRLVIKREISAKYRLSGTFSGIKETFYHLNNKEKYLEENIASI